MLKAHISFPIEGVLSKGALRRTGFQAILPPSHVLNVDGNITQLNEKTVRLALAPNGDLGSAAISP